MQHMHILCLLITPAGVAERKPAVVVCNNATMPVQVGPNKLEAVDPRLELVHARADTMMLDVVADGKTVGRRWLDCRRRASFRLVGHAMHNPYPHGAWAALSFQGCIAGKAR
jgi:hypothetical protein